MLPKYNYHGKDSTVIQKKSDIEEKAKVINRMGILMHDQEIGRRLIYSFNV